MVRIDAAVMMTKPLIVASRRAVSGCIEPPGVSSGCLAATLCTDPAIGRFFPLPCGRSGRKQIPRGLWPIVEGGDQSPQRMIRSYAPPIRVSSTILFVLIPLWSFSPCGGLQRVHVFIGMP